MKKLYVLIDRDSDPEPAIIETGHETNVIRVPKNSKFRMYRADEVRRDSRAMARILTLFGSKALNEVLENRAFYVEIGLGETRSNGSEKKLRLLVKKAFVNLSYRKMQQ